MIMTTGEKVKANHPKTDNVYMDEIKNKLQIGSTKKHMQVQSLDFSNKSEDDIPEDV